MKVHLPGFVNYLLSNHSGCGGGKEEVKGKVAVAVVALAVVVVVVVVVVAVVVVVVGSSVAGEKQKKMETIDLFWVVVRFLLWVVILKAERIRMHAYVLDTICGVKKYLKTMTVHLVRTPSPIPSPGPAGPGPGPGVCVFACWAFLQMSQLLLY
ncbi:hypothetical protein Tco_0998467 [Tanacetum coccineum]